MRKSQDKLIVSPRLKLPLKSPASRQKLKISSPIHSTRSLLGKATKTKKSQQVKKKERIVWLPNPSLYSFIHPLQRIQNINTSFCLSISKKNAQQKIWVISDIDAFIQIYMELNDEMKIECEKWYIISNAVNCKQTEQQFNSLYSPIQFIFLPSISSVCNQMLNYTSNQIFVHLQKVLDLSLVSASSFMCIEETLIQNLSVPYPNYMYIVNDAKQWMIFSTKITASIQPYFITGSEQIKDGKISIRQPITKNKNIIFILFQCEKNIQSLQGFRIYEQNYCRRLLDQKLVEKISTKNEVYLQKIIEKLIIPMKKICIFAQPLSRSALIQISTIRQKFSKEYIILQYSLYKEGDSCYKLKWNTKTRSCKQFTINAAMTITQQIKKIESFISSKYQIQELFAKQNQILKKMQIFLYSKQKDKSYKHFITAALQKCSIKYNVIENLDYLVETHKITVIFGYFTYAQVKSLNRFYNVFLVPVNKQSEEVAPFNQLQQSNQFIQTCITSYNKIYAQIQSVPVQAYIHVLYQKQTQLPTILKSISIPESLLKTHYVPNFHLQFADFKEYSKHLIIAPMDIFEEQLQTQIKQFQWRFNSVTIDVYLLYGQEYIYRNKEGNYKFFKATELQQKINELEQYCKAQQKQKQKQRAVQEPLLQNLNQVDNMKIKDGELDDLRAQQSIVQCYMDNRQNLRGINKTIQENNQRHHQYYNNTKSNDISNKNNGSFIQILNQSSSKPSLQTSEIKNNGQNGSKVQLNYSLSIGPQTQKLIQLTFKKQKQNSNKMEIQMSKNTLKNQQYEFSAKPKKKQQNKPKIFAQKDRENAINPQKHKNSRQKSTYIRQFKQYHHPIKTSPIVKKEQSDNQLDNHDQLNFLKSTNSIGPQFYKLYIFIHRSVPHYSLVRRSHKDYHILLYTRLEEILVFARYLKAEEKIVVIANDQSSQIYAQLIVKSGIKQDKLKIIFNKDLSENYIRNQIDRILSEEKLQQNKEKVQSKKFKALIVYAANNERVLKAVKIVRKIFGAQIKLVFLKQRQYDEMTQSRFKLKLVNGISVYKVGLNAKNNQICITSIRSLFILAMHPDLKDHGFQFKNLSFSIQSFIGRLIYNGTDKDYVLTEKKEKPDSFRKKIQGMKSQKKILPYRQSFFSTIRGQNTDRRKSSSLRHSSMSRTSTILHRSSSSISIIVSEMLKQNISSKNVFSCQQILYHQILSAHLSSKLAIVVITQKQFDMFELFQTQHFQQATKQVIWVIETKTEGKQIFVGSNIVYSLGQNIKEAVQMIIKQYHSQIYFEELSVQSKVQGIKNQIYGQITSKQYKQLKSEYSRTLKVCYFNKLSQNQLKALSTQPNINKLIIVLNKESKILKKVPKNVIQFPSIQNMCLFNQQLRQAFQNKNQRELYPNIGSMILAPQKLIQKLTKMNELSGKKDLLYRPYEAQIFSSMISYSIFRVLIICEKQNQFLIHLNNFPNVFQFDKNLEKVGRQLATILI